MCTYNFGAAVVGHTHPAARVEHGILVVVEPVSRVSCFPPLEMLPMQPARTYISSKETHLLLSGQPLPVLPLP